MSKLTSAKKQKLAAIIGVLIPLFFIVIVAVSVYLPSLSIKPKYDFLYTAGYNGASNNYKVENGKLQKVYDKFSYESDFPTIYRYNAQTNSSRSIDFTNTNYLSLDDSSKSPDGYAVKGNSNDSGGFLFWSSSSNDDVFIQKGTGGKKIETSGDVYDFKFLGWVVNE